MRLYNESKRIFKLRKSERRKSQRRKSQRRKSQRRKSHRKAYKQKGGKIDTIDIVNHHFNTISNNDILELESYYDEDLLNIFYSYCIDYYLRNILFITYKIKVLSTLSDINSNLLMLIECLLRSSDSIGIYIIRRIFASLVITNLENNINKRNDFYIDIHNLNILLNYSNQSDRIEEIQSGGSWRKILATGMITIGYLSSSSDAAVPAAILGAVTSAKAIGVALSTGATLSWNVLSQINAINKLSVSTTKGIELLNELADTGSIIDMGDNIMDATIASFINDWNSDLGCVSDQHDLCDIPIAMIETSFGRDRTLSIYEKLNSKVSEVGLKGIPNSQQKVLNQLQLEKEFYEEGVDRIDSLSVEKPIIDKYNPTTKSIIGIINSGYSNIEGMTPYAWDQWSHQRGLNQTIIDIIESSNNKAFERLGIDCTDKSKCTQKQGVAWNFEVSKSLIAEISKVYMTASFHITKDNLGNLMNLWFMDIIMQGIIRYKDIAKELRVDLHKGDINNDLIGGLLAIGDGTQPSYMDAVYTYTKHYSTSLRKGTSMVLASQDMVKHSRSRMMTSRNKVIERLISESKRTTDSRKMYINSRINHINTLFTEGLDDINWKGLTVSVALIFANNPQLIEGSTLDVQPIQ